MRVTAADTPMTTAKMGSATREMMYVGAGMTCRLDSVRGIVCNNEAFGNTRKRGKRVGKLGFGRELRAGYCISRSWHGSPELQETRERVHSIHHVMIPTSTDCTVTASTYLKPGIRRTPAQLCNLWLFGLGSVGRSLGRSALLFLTPFFISFFYDASRPHPGGGYTSTGPLGRLMAGMANASHSALPVF